MTIGNRRFPLDPEPSEDGNVVLVEVDGRTRARVLTGTELPAQQTAYRPHFVTCANGADFRRRHVARCRACHNVMDPWLPEHGYTTHVGCAVPRDIRDQVEHARKGAR